ncbi:putative proline/glycine betaine transporter (plasmid) [Legionella adelaidensis]|uniref:Proline/betaine transporter ProP6 n=1 Tax=Legionella adelaidensis TaxID=45056 RepID=A0A0W0R3N7_9GAMM|nr:MFS transporter [Legionella adelaidensis]KTC65686.1 proline/betaine transporter ProP6 [Legionella adelaidensis]VEH85968.1 putative proline/glycine betaine transporter [Legionella adelaidensis]
MFKVSKKILVSGAIGNALEMYEFGIWGLFSIYLSSEFLPPGSNLSDIFFLFFISYILRPIGSLIFGILADQIGRKKVLIVGILLMGLCTSLVGILPSYTHIGAFAILFLVLFRLVQIVAIGGEYISSISLLIESCAPNKKGFYGSWAAFGVNSGMLLASLVGTSIVHMINSGAIPDYSWRFAFLVSLLTMFFGLWVRRSIPESFEFIMQNSRFPKRSFQAIFIEMKTTIRSRLFDSFLICSLVAFGVSVTILVFIYAPIHIFNFSKISTGDAFLINSIGLAVLICFLPFFGYLSDIYGRTSILFLGTLSIIFLIIPYFIFLCTGSFYLTLFLHILIGIPCSCVFAVTPVLITEIFPPSLRCSATGILYSLAGSISGGITPLLAFKLANLSGFGFLPSIILIFFGSISLISLSYFVKGNSQDPKLILVKI